VKDQRPDCSHDKGEDTLGILVLRRASGFDNVAHQAQQHAIGTCDGQVLAVLTEGESALLGTTHQPEPRSSRQLIHADADGVDGGHPGAVRRERRQSIVPAGRHHQPLLACADVPDLQSSVSPAAEQLFAVAGKCQRFDPFLVLGVALQGDLLRAGFEVP
jgi:hypothetical protein